MRNTTRFLGILLLCIAVALSASCLTMYLLSSGSSGSLRLVTEQQYEIISRYSRLDQVYTALHEQYYRPLDSDALQLGAIRGMMAVADDPYTFYYTTEQMNTSLAQDEGRYHGIGVIIQTAADGKVHIARVYANSPAADAGLESGDIITAVDGTTVTTVSEITNLILGEDGTEVVLTVLRGEDTLDIPCVRAEVTTSQVSAAILGDNIGYLCITQFSGDAAKVFSETLADMRESGIRGLVLDLRNNPGGYMDQAVAIADEVLPEGLIAYTVDRNGNRTEEHVNADYWDVPMVVLVNGSSASASELFTGAFQDDKRGTVIGTRTYGKGIVQNVVTFASDGAGMQYTVSEYFTPSGRSVHKTGITPDITVELTGKDSSLTAPDPETDNQLDVALTELERLIAERQN